MNQDHSVIFEMPPKYCLLLAMVSSAWLLSRVWLFVTPWTVTHQAPLSLGSLQGRILEWVAMPSSRGFSKPRDRTQVSHIVGRFLPSEPRGKPKNTGMGILFLFQGIFPTQESNWGLLHCKRLFIRWAIRESNSITYICHIFFMSLSADWHLGYFCILVVLSNIYNSALNIWVHLSFVSFWISISDFFKYIWRIETSLYYSSSNFSFLKKPHTAFHNAYTNLDEHQQCTNSVQ